MTRATLQRRARRASSANVVSARALCKASGFTLIELMVVVVIMGVLAALATYGVRKYVLEAKKAEAGSMLTQIRAAEEAYRDEAFAYVGEGDYDKWHPTDTPGNAKHSWDTDTDARREVFDPLGVRSDGPVLYAYTVVKGSAGDTVPAPPAAGSFDFGTQTGPWYVAMAMGDLDGDGSFTYALTYSGTTAVHIEQGY